MKEKNKVIVMENLLIDTGKSSRLAAIRQRNSKQTVQQQKQLSAVDLKGQKKIIFDQAYMLVEQAMSRILDLYPQGKKKTFFRLKYGVEINELDDLALQDIFTLLNLDKSTVPHFRQIEKLNSKGVEVKLKAYDQPNR